MSGVGNLSPSPVMNYSMFTTMRILGCDTLILIALSVAAVSAMRLVYEMLSINTNEVVFAAHFTTIQYLGNCSSDLVT